MKYPELPVFAFICALLVLIPLPWHWRARNVATLAIIAWLFIVNLIYGINAIVWAGNVRDPAPVYCDIASKIVVGASHALPLATLCVCKHLEMVASSRKVSYDITDRRRRMLFEGIMCFVIPMIFMALHYVVQGHRYDVFEDFGCQASVYISIPAIFIIWFPPLLFAVVSFIFAGLALHHFVRRRLVFAAHLQNSNSALTPNRYLRLIAMSVTVMIWNTVLTAYSLYNNVFPGLRRWTDWADVHSNFSRVDIFPAFTLPEYFSRAVLLFWWAVPVSSFIFFLFFGFGEEAMKEYRKVWTWFSRTILRRKPNEKGALLNGKSGRNSPRRLHLVDLKKANSSLDSIISKPIPGTFTTTSSFTMGASSPPPYQKTNEPPSPSSPTSSNTTAAAPPIHCKDFDIESIDGGDTVTVSNFSCYAQSMASTSTHVASPHSMFPLPHIQTLPSHTPRIYISEPIPSPTLSYCSILSPSVSTAAAITQTDTGSSPYTPSFPASAVMPDMPRPYPTLPQPAPAFHRPFSPPNLYPPTRPYPSASTNPPELPFEGPPVNGILVTIHRQALVDRTP